MRRIKSAPANIASMINKKKINDITQINELQVPIIITDKKNKIDYKLIKNIAINKKKITNTIPGIISDSFTETNKYISIADNYILNYIIEFINNFITNKFNKENLENFILSLMVRFVFNQVYHDIIIKIKEHIHLIQ